jgi:drug/metabolite transporter (DMT)-like permease
VLTTLLTISALIAFAGNSVICRAALESGAIDPASFSSIRIISGIVVLYLAGLFNRSDRGSANCGSWAASIALFLYVLLFAYSYVVLGAGLGALILFGCVQVTMLASAIYSGERYTAPQWLGLTGAIAGLWYLLWPATTSGNHFAAGLLMAGAGVAWGIYSLLGRGTSNPLRTTRANFVRTLPLAVLLPFVSPLSTHATPTGIGLAIVGGAVTTGLGYAIWYRALRGLTASEAGLFQLTVPVLAILGGAVMLGEPITTKVLQASAMILCGIAAVILFSERKIRAAN